MAYIEVTGGHRPLTRTRLRFQSFFGAGTRCADFDSGLIRRAAGQLTAMAPKSARVKANNSADTDNNANSDNTDQQYTWSGTPMDKITWFYSNRHWHRCGHHCCPSDRTDRTSRSNDRVFQKRKHNGARARSALIPRYTYTCPEVPLPIVMYIASLTPPRVRWHLMSAEQKNAMHKFGS